MAPGTLTLLALSLVPADGDDLPLRLGAAEPVPRRHGSLEVAAPFLFEAQYTFWNHDLGIDDGAGFGAAFVPSFGGVFQDGEVWAGFPCGIRYWRTEPDDGPGEVEILSYRIGYVWLGYVDPSGLGLQAGMSTGLTRFTTDAPGASNDTGPFVGLRAQGVLAPAPWLWLGAGLEAEWTQTSFGQNRTHGVGAVSSQVSVELRF